MRQKNFAAYIGHHYFWFLSDLDAPIPYIRNYLAV